MSQITRNFTDTEFTRSNTAIKNNINNMLPDEYTDNMMRVLNLLQVIRDSWNAPLIISSGYRCPELNKKVGGASNSDHVYGAAVDFHTVSNTKEDNHKLWNMITCMHKLGKLPQFRQLINEYNDKWIHVSVNNDYNRWKDNQILYVK